MPPWGRPGLHWLRTPFPLRGWGVLRERPCHAPREGGRTVRWGGSRPRALRSAWRPCARSLWALAGGAALTSSTDTPIPRARGGGRAGSTGGRTDAPGRRDGRTARPCPGRRPAPSCCCQRPAGQGPAQVRPRAFRLARLPRPSVRRSPLSIPSPWFRRAALPCTGTLTPGPCRGEGRVQQGRWEGLGGPASARGSVHPYCLHRSCGPGCTPARGDIRPSHA